MTKQGCLVWGALTVGAWGTAHSLTGSGRDGVYNPGVAKMGNRNQLDSATDRREIGVHLG